MKVKRLTLLPKYNEIEKARKIFQEMLEEENIKLEDSFAVEIVITELIANAIEHGVEDIEKSEIVFFIEYESEKIVLGVEYEGNIISDEEFNACILPSEEKPIEELKDCGRGIYMINSIMDDVKHIKEGKMAKIILIKRIK